MFLSNVSLAAPGPVTTNSPTGTTTQSTPVYSWTADPEATHYGVWVRTASGEPVINNKWYTAAEAGCAASTACSLTPPFPLVNGEYRWWIRAIDATVSPSIKGPWTKPGIRFEVGNGGQSVGPVAIIAPTDTTTQSTPVYSWTAVPEATHYGIWVRTASGEPIIRNKWYTAVEAGCAAGTTCSLTPPFPLVNGEHRWWIRAIDASVSPSIKGPWTKPGIKFEVDNGGQSIPSRVTLVSPGASFAIPLDNRTPLFVWDAQANADEYRIKVINNNNSEVSSWISASDANCSTGTGTCEYTLSARGPGEHRWWVQARNSAGRGHYTLGGLRFSLALKIMPTGDSITAGVRGEQSYRLPLLSLLDASGCDYEMVGSQVENSPITPFKSPHEGYSGHRTSLFITGHNNNPGIAVSMSTYNPDVVLVHLGSNDIFQNRSIAEAMTNLDLIVQEIRTSNPDSVVLLANVIPWFASEPSGTTAGIAALGDEIETFVTNLGDNNVHLVDVRAGYTPAMMNNDDIHPNAIGDAHIADAFFSVFDQVSACGG